MLHTRSYWQLPAPTASVVARFLLLAKPQQKPNNNQQVANNNQPQ
jgi:hypothetical protein